MRPNDQRSGPPGFGGTFRTDVLARSLYAEGAGIARVLPRAVAVPGDANDVAVLVQWARKEGYTLMARGSGSGMAGGAVGPGVMVDLSRQSRIDPVNTATQTVTVQTGALRGAIDAHARRVGLRFPVDPSSGAFCTIGGMIGANASGARTLGFGDTRSWVRGVHCVFDDGSTAWIRRDQPPPVTIPAVARLMATLDLLRIHSTSALLQHVGVRKESSGYAIAKALEPGGHLLDVLIGSEGTLAIFLEAELALCPVAGATATALAVFPTLEHATSVAIEARAMGATACELLDRTFLDVAAAEGPSGIDRSAEAVLLIEVEADHTQAATAAIAAVGDACRTRGASDVHMAVDADAQHALWAIRHAASPILARLAPRLRSMQFIEDGCVPPARFPEYVRGVRHCLQRHDVTGVIFGHAGDAHAHVNPLIDVTQSHWRTQVQHILHEVTELTARVGGTLAGEHGDGRLRAPLLHQVWPPEALAAFANIKHAADPSGVFNAGCKIALADPPVAGQPMDHDSLGALRHDPEATPLDPQARVVLDDIERKRQWHRFRLETVDAVPA
jgi:FAD/FMN-containing dehydrogenase